MRAKNVTVGTAGATRMIDLELPQYLYVKCELFAFNIIESIKNPQTEAEARSSLLAMDGAIDFDKQRDAKAAECIFALWCDLDPLKALFWSGPDSGHDLIWHDVLFDVKHTQTDNGCLIWPKSKNHLWFTKVFDAFVLVTGTEFHFRLCKWIPKHHFQRSYKTAGQNHFLAQGTWYLEQKNLYPVWALPSCLPMCISLRKQNG